MHWAWKDPALFQKLEKSSLKNGDEVMFGVGAWSNSKEIVLPSSMVSLKPEKYTFAEAAAFKTVYLTAYVGLIRRGNLKDGETLLVHGASGGVGMAAVELGKLYGAKVIATGTSDEKLKVVKSWGQTVINTIKNGKTSLEDEDLTDGKGTDIIVIL